MAARRAVAPAPASSVVLREGPAATLAGFSRNLVWGWASLHDDFTLRLLDGGGAGGAVLLMADLHGVDVAYGVLASGEPALKFTCVEPIMRRSRSPCGGGGCCGGGGGTSRALTLIIKDKKTLFQWTRAITILFANEDHRPCRSGDAGTVGDECTICISPFENGEVLSCLPCDHRFHEECIVPWLDRSSTCPLCKRDATHQDLQPRQFRA